jgi:hypothetical protein
LPCTLSTTCIHRLGLIAGLAMAVAAEITMRTIGSLMTLPNVVFL